MEDNKKIFREQNLNRITSAEDLHECMHVTSPRLWMLLSAILALIIGFFIFACLVTMENTIETEATVEVYEDNGIVFNAIDITIPGTMGDVVTRGMTVRLEGREGMITSLYENDWEGKGASVQLEDWTDVIAEGTYKAEIVLAKLSPIHFLLN